MRGAAIAALCILSVAAPPAAQARVPATFFGTMWDGAIAQTAPDSTQDREWERMAATGVRAGRATFEWVNIEPEARQRVRLHRPATRLVRAGRDSPRRKLLPVVLYAPRSGAREPHELRLPAQAPGRLRALSCPAGPFATGRTGRSGPRTRTCRAGRCAPLARLERAAPGLSSGTKPTEVRRTGPRDYERSCCGSPSSAIHHADPGAQCRLGRADQPLLHVNLNHLYPNAATSAASFDVAALHPYTTEAVRGRATLITPLPAR